MENNLKFCNKCSSFKEIKFFYKNKKDKILKPCIECKIKYSKIYAEKNKNNEDFKSKRKIYSKIYFIKNKEKILNKTSNYYFNNKKYYKEYQKEYEKINPRKLRKKSPPSIKDRLRSNISRSINKKLKNLLYIKSESNIKYLPFNFNSLKEHLEKQFDHWMNFKNYGKYDPKSWKDDDSSTWTWQIDHIIPHSFFKYTSISDEDFKKCWALDNLRPYSSKQNILDSNKRALYKNINEDKNE